MHCKEDKMFEVSVWKVYLHDYMHEHIVHEDSYVHVLITADLFSSMKCANMQSLLDAKDHKQFKIPTVHVKESFLQRVWFNPIPGYYYGKIACRPNINVRRTIKLEKYSLTSCQVPKMTHKMELKTQILTCRLLHLIVESKMSSTYTCTCMKWLAVNQCKTFMFACVGCHPCFLE